MERELRGYDLNDKQKIRLNELFDRLEVHIYNDTGMKYQSGGFATVDFDYIDNPDDEDIIYATIKWGIQNDVQDEIHTEDLTIPVKALDVKKWDVLETIWDVLETIREIY